MTRRTRSSTKPSTDSVIAGSVIAGSANAAESRKRIVIGITGASGAIYGIRLLESLRTMGIETHLVLTRAAEMTIAYETDHTAKSVRALADKTYPLGDVGAAIASGSFRTLGMIVAPCSMKTLGEIAYSMSSNLLTRAADVVLKERRRLVLMPRETPLHLGHIRAMAAATEIGAIIAPPMPAFYAKPKSLDEMVAHSVGRVLDLFDLDSGMLRRWHGKPERD